MNFFKRAWLVTKAKKGRTGLLVLVTSAILIFVLAGLTIKNAANSAVESAKSKAGATVTLSVNREAMMKAFKPDSENSSDSNESSGDSSDDSSAVTSVGLATAKSIAEKDDVASYLFTTTTTATAGDGISAISTSSSSDDASDSASTDSNQPDRGGMMASGDFTITGVNSTDYVTDFTSGTSEIKKGVGITSDTADNSAVISSDLADENDLSVGDTFTVSTTVDDTETSYTLTVVGIYDNSSTATTAQMMSNASNPQNNIYTNLTTANTMKGETDTLDSAVYTLSNPKNMDAFVKEIKSDIDTDSYSVTSSDEIYEQMLSPLNNISSIAQNIVILVAVAGAVILTLIVILSIRERRYEIGVLMSLGENRLKIIGQFFTELLMVTVVSLVIASFAGNFVGNALGNQLLSSSTSTEQTTQNAGPGAGGPGQDTKSSDSNTDTNSNQKPSAPGNGGGRGMGNMVAMATSSSQEIDDLDIKLTGTDVAKLGGIALLISFVSTILASIGIIRMKPKDILTSN
ncbi:putative ABC transport system permease protein [Streptococcus equinus]|uniref:Putative ABC transport system permease protein n=1 Tax=Streptococcus equinus TaxID=1335 RepID=A0A239RA64_STREI|nr:ABC transporter permease [Streptococcus equinus]SNU07521.1 putative ABC transport system permease protein [Streptococcus equinus]